MRQRSLNLATCVIPVLYSQNTHIATVTRPRGRHASTRAWTRPHSTYGVPRRKPRWTQGRYFFYGKNTLSSLGCSASSVDPISAWLPAFPPLPPFASSPPPPATSMTPPPVPCLHAAAALRLPASPHLHAARASTPPPPAASPLPLTSTPPVFSTPHLSATKRFRHAAPRFAPAAAPFDPAAARFSPIAARLGLAADGFSLAASLFEWLLLLCLF